MPLQGDTVRKGDTASYSHVPILILWSTSTHHHPRPATDTRKSGTSWPARALEQLDGPDKGLYPWHMVSDVTGRRKAGTDVCHSQNFLLVFLFAGVYTARTPHLNYQGQGMGLLNICSCAPGTRSDLRSSTSVSRAVCLDTALLNYSWWERGNRRGTMFFMWVPRSLQAFPRAL